MLYTGVERTGELKVKGSSYQKRVLIYMFSQAKYDREANMGQSSISVFNPSDSESNLPLNPGENSAFQISIQIAITDQLENPPCISCGSLDTLSHQSVVWKGKNHTKANNSGRTERI